ncbi:DUF397 domain-containing protein [Saccharothrix sp. NEAU-S10]|nr:DUF397 domain-containing protein [Saccharothrix luteola]
MSGSSPLTPAGGLLHPVQRSPAHRNNGNNSNCVEVSPAGVAARVRDSKNPAGPTVTLPDWQGFLEAVECGKFTA